MHSNLETIPKKIWILWYQGILNAPELVKKCINSWVKLNKDWEITILDADNLNQYVDLEIPMQILDKMSIQTRSDLIRLALLKNYGGVWIDATTYCLQPLDSWLQSCSNNDFFCFYRPSNDRLISSWFIASQKGGDIPVKLFHMFRDYLIQNDFNRTYKFKWHIEIFLNRALTRNVFIARYWFNPLVTKVLKISPYFAFHYMFERLISSDQESKSIWKKMKKICAVNCTITEAELLKPLTNSTRYKIENKEVPILKLTWKYKKSEVTGDSVISYILRLD